jgi:hypothetical protein
MFPWSLIGTALKTGAEIYKNKKKSENYNVRSKNRAC